MEFVFILTTVIMVRKKMNMMQLVIENEILKIIEELNSVSSLENLA